MCIRDRVSRAGNLLLYEIKQGGERTGTFSLFDVERRQTLPDALPRGYLRGFAFGPDGTDCYYVHRPIETAKPFYRAVYRHTLNTSSKLDEEIFFAGDGNQIRLGLIADNHRLGILQYDQSDKLRTTFYLRPVSYTHLFSFPSHMCDFSLTGVDLNQRPRADDRKQSKVLEPNIPVQDVYKRQALGYAIRALPLST